MAGSERAAAIAVLRSYSDRFTTILNMLVGGGILTGARKQEAQQLLRELKADLKAECKELHRRRDQLNRFEYAFVEPALRHAEADIMTAVNSVPNQKWHSDLYGARLDITQLLSSLESVGDDWMPGGK